MESKLLVKFIQKSSFQNKHKRNDRIEQLEFDKFVEMDSEKQGETEEQRNKDQIRQPTR